MPDTKELPEYLRALDETPAPLTDWPDFDSDLGRRFRVACAVVFSIPVKPRRGCGRCAGCLAHNATHS